MCLTIMSTKDSNTFSKYAVIRLKTTDNLLGLFQLLLHNGYSQVSFVNSLNETIFPTNDRLEKCTQTSVSDDGGGQQQQQQQQLYVNAMSGQSNKPSQAAVSPFDQRKTSVQLNLDLLPHNLAHFGPLTGLPTIPSGFLGLPTLPSLLPHQNLANGPMFAGNILPDATTPPYAVVNGHQNVVRPATQQQCLTKPPSSVSKNVAQPSTMDHRPSHNIVADQDRTGGSGVRPCLNSEAAMILSSVPTATNTQLRQRGQRSFTDDPSLYVVCRLCKNRIMGSRISNLTNHVRRHSTLKQFQCCYCDYTHNEMAKVRLHMLHNHKDKESQPIDNLSPEMQIAWEQLMKECFPEHCQNGTTGNGNGGGPGRTTTTSTTNKTWKNVGVVDGSGDSYENGDGDSGVAMYDGSSAESTGGSDITKDDKEEETSSIPLSGSSPDYVQRNAEIDAAFVDCVNDANGQKAVQCIECNQFVNAKNRARHIRSCHLQCLPFLCSMCGYDHAEHCKVKLHIVLKHDDDPAAHVLTRDVSQMMEQLVPRFFPQTPTDMSPPANVASPLLNVDEPMTPEEKLSSRKIADDNNNNKNNNVVVDEKIKCESMLDPLQLPMDLQCFLAPTFEPLKHSLPTLLTAEQLWPKDLAATLASHAIKRRYSSSSTRHLVTPYQCPKCSYSSSSYRRMTNHVALRHTIGSNNESLLQYAK